MVPLSKKAQVVVLICTYRQETYRVWDQFSDTMNVQTCTYKIGNFMSLTRGGRRMLEKLGNYVFTNIILDNYYLHILTGSAL